MSKKFNDTGLCIPTKHYMADTSAKLAAILKMVDEGAYFTINRPRQYGKTTIAYLLSQHLADHDQYVLIEMSFEGIGDSIFEREEVFCKGFIELLIEELTFQAKPELSKLLQSESGNVVNLNTLSKAITKLTDAAQKKMVLTIDEIDKSGDNQLFLSFLGMLREKYLSRNRGRDTTFQAVMLIGVHDIKSLKLKISPETRGKLNSPWNIAVDFKVEMSFSASEIQPMLAEYAQEHSVQMNISELAERIYYYTSGYPYLVSKICKVADEELFSSSQQTAWDLDLINAAFRYIVDEAYSTTLFDDMGKNLEKNPDLYELIFEISFNGKKIPFNVLNPVINLGSLYGILRNEAGFCSIHNRIFEQKIYAYMVSKQLERENPHTGILTSKFYTADALDLPQILRSFQQFMKEHYSDKDAKFLEREGRLLFLSFLKPIINGQGFDFKEPNVAEERRMDVVLTFGKYRYIVELKRWEGEAYHQRGLQQLSDYLDSYGLTTGYLLIYDFRKNKIYREESIQFQDKHIFAVWV